MYCGLFVEKKLESKIFWWAEGHSYSELSSGLLIHNIKRELTHSLLYPMSRQTNQVGMVK